MELLRDIDIAGYKYIIIGAGVCGAMVAYKLAAKHKVLVLEAGTDQLDRVEFAGQYARTSNKHPGSPYSAAGEGDVVGPDNKKGYYVDPKEQFKSTFLRIGGGSTWHFLGNVPRFVPDDFKLQEKYQRGVNWPIIYDDLEEYYCDAETEMGVSCDHDVWNNVLGAHRSRPYPMNKIWQSYGDQLFIDGLKDFMLDGRKIDILPTPQARNSTIYDGRPACAGNSTCVPICPIQAKYDATVHIKKAQKQQALFAFNTIVKQLIKDDNDLIVKIKCVDVKTKETFELDTQGKTIIVAAHAIETPRLLLNSGLARASKQVGKNLMDHLQGYCVGVTPRPVFPFRGPITTSGIDVFRNGNHRKDFAAFRMSIGNDGWGRVGSPGKTVWTALSNGIFGEALVKYVADSITHMSRISFSTEMLPEESNNVDVGKEVDMFEIPRPVLSFGFNDYNKQALKYAYHTSRQILEKVGCKVDDKVTDQFDTEGNFKTYTGAGHIMGTTRMGTDSHNSVVDSFGQVHEHKNLYIVGPSTFPTSGTANPTLTAVALSLRTANKLMDS
jgi:choline dehydrogenase-like flavoprotein